MWRRVWLCLVAMSVSVYSLIRSAQLLLSVVVLLVLLLPVHICLPKTTASLLSADCLRLSEAESAAPDLASPLFQQSRSPLVSSSVCIRVRLADRFCVSYEPNPTSADFCLRRYFDIIPTVIVAFLTCISLIQVKFGLSMFSDCVQRENAFCFS